MNEDIKKSEERRSQIYDRLHRIGSLKANPEMYHLNINDLTKLDKEAIDLQKELRSLPEPTSEYTVNLKTVVSYEGKSLSLKPHPKEKGKYLLYMGSEGVYSQIEYDVNGKPTKAIRTIQNSDTNGLQVKVVYNFVYDQPEPTPKPIQGYNLVFGEPDWICSSCGYSNNTNLLVCLHCRTPRSEEEKNTKSNKKDK